MRKKKRVSINLPITGVVCDPPKNCKKHPQTLPDDPKRIGLGRAEPKPSKYASLIARPERGSDPLKWEDKYPRYPHPADIDWGKFPEEVMRLEPAPAICECNDDRSMRYAATQQTKNSDRISLWCSSCWLAPWVDAKMLKEAYRGNFIKFVKDLEVSEGATKGKTTKGGAIIRGGK